MNDQNFVNKVTNMLAKLLMTNEAEDPISVPLPERKVHRIGNRISTGKEFMLSLELGGIRNERCKVGPRVKDE